MRRMYSEQELTKIIKEVSEAYISELIEEGEFDDDIASYVDAYLVEHPVDITALEGQTIAPANINATGNITGASIIENMSGYDAQIFTDVTDYNWDLTPVYVGACKNGNKLSLVSCFKLKKNSSSTGDNVTIFAFTIPNAVGAKLYPTEVGGYPYLDQKALSAFYDPNTSTDLPVRIAKQSNTELRLIVNTSSMVVDREYLLRYEATFLLSDNLLS